MRFPPTRFSSTHHGRSRHGHHAMPYDRRDSGNDPRVRGVDDQDTRHSYDRPDQPPSPHHIARPAPTGRTQDCSREESRSSDAIPQVAPRDGRRDIEPLPHHLQSRSPTTDQSYHDLQTQRQNNSNYHRRRRRRKSISRNGEPQPLPRSRDDEAAPSPVDHSAKLRSPGCEPIEDLDQRRSRSRSPLTREQRTGRSPFADDSHPRRPRQGPSLRRPNREPRTVRSALYPPRPDRPSPPRDAFPTRREQRRSKKKGARANTPPQPPYRDRSPSPRLDLNSSENPNLVPLGQRPTARHDLDPSTASIRHSFSRSQQRASSPQHRERRPSSSYIDFSHRRTADPDFEEYGSPASQLRDSWNDCEEPLTSKRVRRRRSRAETAELASGANSIEVNMSARGNFRGSHGAPHGPRGHYNQGAHDTRNYPQSSNHGTPNSSAQGSPAGQSSHSGGRGNWNGSK